MSLNTDIKMLLPVCSEAAAKAHKIAIEAAKNHPDKFHEVYLSIYNREFNKLYTLLIKQF